MAVCCRNNVANFLRRFKNPKIAIVASRVPSKCSFHTSLASCSGHSIGRPLEGIKILDLTRVLAGPFCTMILGDMGAEVIKVERPGCGDETRTWGPPFIGKESCYFFSVNRNKKSICVDLKNPEGVTIIEKLAQQSDILIENYVPGKLDALGLGYKSLHAIAPKLIYCSITGYGSDGPYKNRAGYDVIAASIGGLLSITGPENGEPCKVGVAMTDLSTGLFAHGAILAAILERNRSGIGQKIDCNLLSTQVACLVNMGTNYLNAEIEGKKWGTAHESIVPYQAFKTADSYITIGAGNDKQFEVLCKILECTELLTDSRFTSNKLRVKHRTELINELNIRLSKKNTEQWLHSFENCGIPYGPINSFKQVFKDPQVLHNQMVQTFDHPTAGEIKLAGPPVQFNGQTNSHLKPPPELGQHTDEILTNVLSYSDADIERLKQLKVIQ